LQAEHPVDLVALFACEFVQGLGHHACVVFKQGFLIALQILKTRPPQVQVLKLALCGCTLGLKPPELCAKLIECDVPLRRHVLIA
jgi:hypothetical protein